MSEEVTRDFSGGDLQGIHARFDSMNARFDSVDGRLEGLDGRLTALEDKVDRRLQETRPIWEQVLAKLESLEMETRKGFRKLERQMGQLAVDVIEVRGYQQDLEKRVDKIEDERAQRS